MAWTAGALGVGLLGAGAGVALLRDDEPDSLAPGPEPEPEPPSIVASYVPDLDRVHTLNVYQSVATKSAAVELIDRRAREAIVEAELEAIEIDLFFDDIFHRKSKLVLMGEHEQWFIGFTYRYLVDMTYPSKWAEPDGFGAPEWGRHSLTLLGATYTLKQLEGDERPRPGPNNVAWVEAVGDHDAAIVYFPKSAVFAREHLGILDAPAVIREALAESSALFGLEYTLISPESLAKLRRELERRSLNIQLFVTGLAVAALVFLPLLGGLGGAGSMSEGLLASQGRKLVAKALPVAFDLGRDLLLREDGFVARHLGEDTRLSLLGVEFPRGDTDALGMIEKFLNALAERGEAGQFVEFSSANATRSGQVFVPGRRMALSGELLSRGLARLDTRSVDVIREFPEFVDLALAAIDTKQNLAERWAEDRDYVAELRALHRVVAG